MKTRQIYALVLTAALALGTVALRASTTDDKIEAAFKNSYVFKTYLSSDSIKVESKQGVVTLTGTVSEETHKHLAAETAENLPGVTRVDNRLEVAAGGGLATSGSNSDAWIAAKVRATLLFHSNVSAGTQIDVKNGVVSLHGDADSVAQRNLTAEYAKDVDGVTRVNNEMTVGEKPHGAKLAPVTAAEVRRDTHKAAGKIDDASITAQVKVALLLNHSTSSIKTKVTTTNGVVTLRGQVESMNAMHRAVQLVKDVNGVKSVRNEMAVGPDEK